MNTLLTANRLRAIVSYNPEHGNFVWIKSKQGRTIGRSIGYYNNKGYIKIRINGVIYSAHRLAWLYMTGEWPDNQIGHINGKKSDNRFINLRQADNSINAQNRHKARKDSVTGVMGVCLRTDKYRVAKSYCASIMVSGVRKCLGYFSTIEEAHLDYIKEKQRIHKGYTK